MAIVHYDVVSVEFSFPTLCLVFLDALTLSQA